MSTLPATALRSALESSVGPLAFQPRPAPEVLPTGIAELDAVFGGLPRGSVTEFTGTASSGRTAVMLAALAAATRREEYCAVVDAGDAFDPTSAAATGVALERLLWVRCGGNAEHALKAADLLTQGGGFGLVVMDLGDVPLMTARRISLASWYRLRRAVEHTPAILLVIEQEANAQSCAALTLRFCQERARWSGDPGCSYLLRGVSVTAEASKPARAGGVRFEALAS